MSEERVTVRFRARSVRPLAVLSLAATVAALAVVLGGGTSAASTGATGKTIGFMLGVQNNPFYQSEQCGATRAAKQRGYNIEFDAPAQFDSGLSVQVINAMAAKKPAGLIVDPVFPQQEQSAIEGVIKSGVPVLSIQETLSAPGQIANLVSQHTQLGVIAADLLAKKIGSGQVYVSDFQQGSESTDDRRIGFLKELKKYPNLKYVGDSFTGTDLTKAAQAMSGILLRYPNLKAVFGTNLYSIEGDLTAIQQAGKQKQITVISTDTLPIEIGWLQKGQVYALIGQRPAALAAQAVNMLADAIEGKIKPQNKTIYLQNPFFTATQANMNNPAVKSQFATGKC
jgi:ribose transport system substrate-binding protein